MATEPPPNKLNDDSPGPPIDGRNYLLGTWFGPASFVLLYMIAFVLAAAGIPNAGIGVCLGVCLVVGPIVGMVSALTGMQNGSNGCAMVLGLLVNVTIICLFLIFIAGAFLKGR